jgi:hypothetical protein
VEGRSFQRFTSSGWRQRRGRGVEVIGDTAAVEGLVSKVEREGNLKGWPAGWRQVVRLRSATTTFY